MIHRKTLCLAYWRGYNGYPCHYQRKDYRRAWQLGADWREVKDTKAAMDKLTGERAA